MEAKKLLEQLEQGQDELREHIPEEMEKFKAFSEEVMQEGALSTKQKKLIALGAALAKQCKHCILTYSPPIHKPQSWARILKTYQVSSIADCVELPRPLKRTSIPPAMTLRVSDHSVIKSIHTN